METESPPPHVTGAPSDRFAPRATGAMARMFDCVSGHYRLLNRILTLGQDRAWRRALWAAVPEHAHVVLDLCTGDGSSLPGLRRPGRLVIGLDASLAMLELAAEADWRGGWGPRLVCGDAFHLPFAAGSLDAVTIAFGIRNLRPQDAALAELARVLRPGGTLAVLEATGPRRGALAPLHRFYLRRIVPVLGRLSRDPSAYRYLAESILEFGPGDLFTSAAEQHGFHWRGARRFMLGATRLWVASAPLLAGEIPAGAAGSVQAARLGESPRGEMPIVAGRPALEQRASSAVQGLLSLALSVALGAALARMLNPNIHIPLDRPRRALLLALVVGGMVVFGARGVMFLLRTLRPTPRI